MAAKHRATPIQNIGELWIGRRSLEAGFIRSPRRLARIASAYFGHAAHHGSIDLHKVLKSSGTSPNLLITLAGYI